MKKTVAFIAAMLAVSIAFAQYENADAVFEKITKEYTLNEDGSTDFHYFKQLRLNSYVAFNRLYGETFIIYNPDFQNLKINESYTIMADGTRVETPDNAYNEVLPRAAAHSDAHSHLREMVVTHTGLERGATIYLDYTLHTAAEFLPALMGNEIIQESSPVKEMELVVKVPADVELSHKMYNLRTAPEMMIQGRQKVYTWKFAGIEASSKEPMQGDYQPETPRLVFSSVQNAGMLIDWLADQKAFEYKLNEEMKTWAASQKDPEDEIGSMLKIQKEVAENIALDRAPAEWTGYRMRTPIEVWKSNGGNQLEKAILLASLLRAADFNAVPVMAGPRQFFDEEAGNLLLLDHSLVMVNTKGNGTLYLSAANTDNQSLGYKMTDLVMVPLRAGTDLNLVNPPTVTNEIDVEGSLKFEDIDKLTGMLEVELLGAVNPFLLLKENPEGIKAKFTGGIIAKDDEAVKIENSNPEQTTLALKVKKTDSLQSIAGYYRYELPVMRTGFESWRISYLPYERQVLMVLPFTIEEEYEYEINIPEGYSFSNRELNIDVKSRAGSVKITSKIKGTKMEIKREIHLKETAISPADYQKFRDMINEWLDDDYRAVVFQKSR
ncbi:MAG: DUF3857 domain-containing protein [Bacteroidales bacterium]